MSPRILLLSALFAAMPAAAPAAHIVLIAGGGTSPTDVPATEAKLVTPFGIDFDRTGNAFLVELNGNRVLKIDARGRLTTLAGSGKKGFGGDGGPAGSADLNGPHNLAVAPNGDVYVADTWNNRVRKIDAKTGVITTFAGTGEKGFAGDGGPADKAQFGGIYCITFSPDGRKLHLADLDNRRIRAVDMATNVVTTVAGNGQKGVPEDGARAVEAPLVDPRAVASDANGNVYVLERSGHALRVVSNGRIRTVVGTGKKGLSGDGGPGKEATLAGPKHLCVDRDGDVIIADSDNHCVRKYSPKTGVIVRLAGTGKVGKDGIGGPPERAQLNQPHGVTLSSVDGSLFICDSMNDRVLKIVP